MKEQLAKGNPTVQKYWLRFELRYYKEKAYSITYNLLNQGQENFRQFVFSLLYMTLDIKKYNRFSNNDQNKVATDPRYLRFLENVSKAKLEKYKLPDTALLNYQAWAMPHISMYLLVTIMACGGSVEQALTKIMETGLSIFESFDSTKLKKINRFRKELDQKVFTQQEIMNIKKQLEKLIAERSLPF